MLNKRAVALARTMMRPQGHEKIPLPPQEIGKMMRPRCTKCTRTRKNPNTSSSNLSVDE